jgi:hypothetical protein
MMGDSPRSIFLQAIYHQTIPPRVCHIRISFIAFPVTHIHDYIREEGILFNLKVWDPVTQDNVVGAEVEDKQLRRTSLARRIGHVRHTGVKNPQPATRVDGDPED